MQEEVTQIGKEKLDIIGSEQGYPLEKFSFNVFQPRKNVTKIVLGTGTCVFALLHSECS
jgi:hypothetical protein